MSLTPKERVAYSRLRKATSSKQSAVVSDDDIRLLIYITAADLGLAEGMKVPKSLPGFFDPEALSIGSLPGGKPESLFQRLCELEPAALSYLNCLSALHKARLKYNRVLETQSFSNMNQVGLRGLLQYGLLDVDVLASLLVWRKWLYDIDNRAAQDTGYVVEPVLASAIGGVAYSSRNSPIKRLQDPTKARQVDCIKGDLAYEFKLRITIAASGQGRWGEELDFAADCRASNFTPILLVLDPTVSSKLSQLQRAFVSAGGQCFSGEAAWEHLRTQASSQMGIFISRYIEEPLKDLFAATPDGGLLLDLNLEDQGHSVVFGLGSSLWAVDRESTEEN